METKMAAISSLSSMVTTFTHHACLRLILFHWIQFSRFAYTSGPQPLGCELFGTGLRKQQASPCMYVFIPTSTSNGWACACSIGTSNGDVCTALTQMELRPLVNMWNHPPPPPRWSAKPATLAYTKSLNNKPYLKSILGQILDCWCFGVSGK